MVHIKKSRQELLRIETNFDENQHGSALKITCHKITKCHNIIMTIYE